MALGQKRKVDANNVQVWLDDCEATAARRGRETFPLTLPDKRDREKGEKLNWKRKSFQCKISFCLSSSPHFSVSTKHHDLGCENISSFPICLGVLQSVFIEGEGDGVFSAHLRHCYTLRLHIKVREAQNRSLLEDKTIFEWKRRIRSSILLLSYESKLFMCRNAKIITFRLPLLPTSRHHKQSIISKASHHYKYVTSTQQTTHLVCYDACVYQQSVFHADTAPVRGASSEKKLLSAFS